MNIPHLPPIKFAQEKISVQDNIAKVKVCFPSIPTLPMLFESAAQSSAAFSSEESKEGFVISLKDIELLNDLEDLEYIAQIKKEHEFGQICEFSFEILKLDEKEKFAKGIFTIMVKE
ncbi:hypothetical protein [Arcobacter sp. CECT 8985]|uniref:hypothetical protein n=1 Tax=Arcobacter sp. CECT 8985 TaxID=1935424 RepID=UPI00100B21BE|nr:hypothetical protein [Arcobacter sp. CECT 8985]RXJ84825.1 hypothetical protein CRU93_12160 [Arcobacter sp. CECT 8985]